MNLKQKLVEIRKHIGVLRKTEKGQNCQYVDPAVLLLKATDKMNELAVVLTSNIKQTTLTREPNPTKNNPNSVDFCVSLDIDMIFSDAESDEVLTIPWFAFGTDSSDPAKAGGKALTYGERYFFLKQFNIPSTKDDPDYLKDQVRGPEFLSDPQKNTIRCKVEEIKGLDPKFTDEPFLKYMGVNSVDEIYSKNFNTAMVCLNAALKGRTEKAA